MTRGSRNVAAPTMARWFATLRAAPAKWRRRNGAERLLLLEALLLLGVVRILILTIPFRWLAVSLGRRMTESGLHLTPSALRQASMIGQAVRSAAGTTPWKSVCLPQAVAGKWMLKRRGINATLYLGVAKADNRSENLAAHAWLRCGDQIITGAAGHRQFTVVASFS
ncbi:lasso peptide biosynthesis B2 protein [Pelobacter propionicus]|uniref:lasso peptide biosynthesis B2 protein n=1 Tax=Pelobacter propionicus TaxID=29543 RepID=UPI001E5041AE|nr:lasso peptide biosynthesis B2 protein [Pelobacter propionicus]